jgi:hypothetical protein
MGDFFMEENFFTENTLIKKSNSLKWGSAIKLFSIIALICTTLSCMSYFFHFDYDDKLAFSLTNIDLTNILLLILALILTMSPVVLLVLYIFKFHNKLKATFIIPIIFGIFVLNPLSNSFIKYTFNMLLPDTIYSILDLITIVCSILAAISALKGFNKKIFIIIAMVVCLLYELFSLLETITFIKYYLEYSLELFMITEPLKIIGEISLYVALLLFSLKNKIPSIISLSANKENN